MTTLGWIIMLTSIVCVVSLTVFCYTKVLTLPPLGPDEHV